MTTSIPRHETSPRVRQALEALGIRNLLLGVHDAAFPCLPEEDVGRGTPYSAGAERFLDFVRHLGFDGLQLGPQGATAAGNPSPYDGTLFSRNPLSLALLPLTEPEHGELLPRQLLAELAALSGDGGRVPYGLVYAGHRRAREAIWHRFRSARAGGASAAIRALDAAFAAFRTEHADWLDRDAIFGALRRAQGDRDWSEWPDALDRCLFAPPPSLAEAAARRLTAYRVRYAEAIESWAFFQFLLLRQHGRLQAHARALGIKLFGDLQIGLSRRDAWAAQGWLLRSHVMGAPPSRTNPEGQPWNYGVLDPSLYFEAGGGRRDGAAIRFLRSRVEKMFAEFDGLRIDHPHGLVCPWVYRAGQPDPHAAVRGGARLFSSPDLEDHPELASHAIARRDQLDVQRPRHDDRWIVALDDEQVEGYAALFDVIVEAARSRGDVRQIACEVLSTQPYPLQRVMQRHGLGRFRVTQKANLSNPRDVYRGENAAANDWIMIGNHDTPPIWAVAERWLAAGTALEQARYLAGRLLAPEEDREAWAARVARSSSALAQAKFAELFVGPARNLQVFFSDLFGLRETYNKPGIVDDTNWSLRVPRDFARLYDARRRAGGALDLPRALARALRSRGAAFVAAHRSLIDDLSGTGERPDRAAG